MIGITNVTTNRTPEATLEIVVTPEMIEAGIGELVAYNPKFDLEEDAVCRIYRAMAKVV